MGSDDVCSVCGASQDMARFHRRCFTCGVQISQCNGFTLGRDLLARENGKIPPAWVRELCQFCADAARHQDAGYYPGCGPLG